MHLKPQANCQDDPNIAGIFAALRYLSLEAENAGLTDLAGKLTEAALHSHLSIATSPAHRNITNYSSRKIR